VRQVGYLPEFTNLEHPVSWVQAVSTVLYICG